MFTKNNNIIINALGLVSDLNSMGNIIGTKDNKYRIMLGNEFDTALYRGENKLYPGFSPSASRAKNTKEHCEQWVKKELFKQIFLKTPYYQILTQMNIGGRYFEFDLEALAQHYEFATNYLDLTRDILVAMFFAYTDKNEQGYYYPITNFEGYQPTLYQTSMPSLSISNPNDLKIVGFQAALRPAMQQAMAIDLTKPDGNIENSFSKTELPKDPNLSLGIYNSFKKGCKIFPQEKLSQLALLIHDSKKMNEELFEVYCNKYNNDKNTLQNELNEAGFTFTHETIHFTEEGVNEMALEVNKDILPWLNKYIGLRMVSEPLNPK